MKYTWISAAIAAALLTACQPYNSQMAPVSSLNARNQATVATPQANMQSSSPTFSMPTRETPPATPLNAQLGNTRTLPQFDESSIKVNQASPYSNKGSATPYHSESSSDNASQNDGWDVTPGQKKAQEQQPEKADSSSTTDNSGPLRPKERSQQEAAPAKSDDTDTAAGSNAAPQPADKQQVASTNGGAARQTSGGSAVSTLLQKAADSLGKGDLDGAAAYLENAQRIDSQNAKILYDIANIRYHQGRYGDAENFAGRAVNVGGSNGMMKKSWALIANARKALGDNQGAIAAAEKAAALGN